jgi:hypothetical protein
VGLAWPKPAGRAIDFCHAARRLSDAARSGASCEREAAASVDQRGIFLSPNDWVTGTGSHDREAARRRASRLEEWLKTGVLRPLVASGVAGVTDGRLDVLLCRRL